MKFEAKWTDTELRAVLKALDPKAYRRAVKKAGSTALRDMRAETSKTVRATKRLKAKTIKADIVLERPKGRPAIDGMQWALGMKGKPVPLARFPHRATKKKGVLVTVNRGQRSRLPHAFVATSKKSGYYAIWQRTTNSRFPIEPQFGTRPSQEMRKPANAERVLRRGRDSFGKTWERVLPLEMEKAI